MSHEKNPGRLSPSSAAAGGRETGGFKPLGLRAVAAAARSVGPSRKPARTAPRPPATDEPGS